jgi:hypothetical protein
MIQYNDFNWNNRYNIYLEKNEIVYFPESIITIGR